MAGSVGFRDGCWVALSPPPPQSGSPERLCIWRPVIPASATHYHGPCPKGWGGGGARAFLMSAGPQTDSHTDRQTHGTHSTDTLTPTASTPHPARALYPPYIHPFSPEPPEPRATTEKDGRAPHGPDSARHQRHYSPSPSPTTAAALPPNGPKLRPPRARTAAGPRPPHHTTPHHTRTQNPMSQTCSGPRSMQPLGNTVHTPGPLAARLAAACQAPQTRALSRPWARAYACARTLNAHYH